MGKAKARSGAKPEHACAPPPPPAFSVGDRVDGNYRGEGDWYPGRIAKVHADGAARRYDVHYDDGDREAQVRPSCLRPRAKKKKNKNKKAGAGPRWRPGRTVPAGDGSGRDVPAPGEHNGIYRDGEPETAQDREDDALDREDDALDREDDAPDRTEERVQSP